MASPLNTFKTILRSGRKFLHNRNGVFSVLILATSSISFFISNYAAKTGLIQSDYLTFSYYITIFTIIQSYALTGSESLILKYCTFEKNSVYVPIDILKILIFNVLLSCIVFILLNGEIFDIEVKIFDLIFINITFSIVLFLTQIQRISKKFQLGQLTANFWRLIIILPLATYLFFLTNVKILFVFRAAIVATFIYVFIVSKKINIKLRSEGLKLNHKIIKDWLAFSFSIFVIQLLFNGDKFLVDSGLVKNLNFAEYFYFAFIGLIPINLFSTLISFILGPSIKSNLKDPRLFSTILKQLLIVGIAFCLSYHTALYLLKESLSIDIEDTAAYFLISLIGVIRIEYSILSVYMNLIANPAKIFLSNLSTIIGGILLYIIISYFLPEKSITWLLILIFSIFLLRSGIFFFRIKNEINAQSFWLHNQKTKRV